MGIDLPSLPRLPFVPDLLRRIRVPRTSTRSRRSATEATPATAASSADASSAIWSDAVVLVPQRRPSGAPGLRPPRRARSSSTARSATRAATARRRSRRHREGAATPETPFCVYSASKAITAFVVHKLIERGLHRPRRARSASTSPATSATARARSRSATSSPTAPACRTCRARRSTSITSATASSWCEILCDAKPFAKPGRLLAYHAVSGGFILGEVVHRVTGKDIREVLAEEFLDPLGFRWTNYGVAEADVDAVASQLHHRAADAAAALEAAHAGARACRSTTSSTSTNDPRFLTGIVPAGQHGHHRQRALALLRDDAPRRRARRRPGDEPETIRTRADRAVAPRVRPLARLPDPVLLRPDARRRACSASTAATPSTRSATSASPTCSPGPTPSGRCSVAVLTNGKPIVYPEMHRFLGLMQRITSEAPKVEGDQLPF